MNAENLTHLELEVDRIHEFFFGRPPCKNTVNQYLNAHAYLFKGQSESSQLLVSKIIKLPIDIEAVEVVLRRSKPLLTKKIHLLFYLCEVKAPYQAYFINYENKNWFLSVFTLKVSLIKTIFKAIKGKFLIWRHQLV